MVALLLMVNAIGWTLIHSLWLGAIAALAYALPAARLRNESPQAAYAWGLACLLGLVALLGGVFLLEFDRLRSSADASAIAAAYAALPVPGAAITVEAAPQGSAAVGVAAAIEPLLPLLVLLWALAVSAIGLGLARSQLALRRLVRAGLPIAELAAPVQELAQHFGIARPIAVVSSTIARVPFVIGYWSPVIVLPLSIVAGMPLPQLRLILAHEIAHLRRADYLVNWLQVALEVLLFFHPAVRWLSEELRRLREACCDDLVVAYAEGGRVDYTRALLSLEQHRHEAPLLAPSAVAGGLLWRVQRIAGRAPRERSGMQRIVLPAVLLGFLASVLGGGVQVRPGAAPREFELPQLALEAVGARPQATLGTGEWQAQLPPLASIELAPAAPGGMRAAPREAAIAPAAPAVLLAPALRLDAVAEAPAAPADTPAMAPARAAAALAPLHTVAPRYPARQRLGDRIVTIELSFDLDPAGRVVAIRPELAPANAQAFVDSASAALAQWRYPADGGAALGGERLRHRFVFRDPNKPKDDAGCSLIPGTRVCVVEVTPQRSQLSPLSGRRCDARTGTRLCRR